MTQDGSSGAHFAGDGRKIRVDTNRGTLRVVGDRTRLQVKVNLGTIVYTGRQGRVQVGDNLGSVRYVGDGGLVEVERASHGGVVKYTGSGGKVLGPAAADRRAPAGGAYTNLQDWCVGLATTLVVAH